MREVTLIAEFALASLHVLRASFNFVLVVRVWALLLRALAMNKLLTQTVLRDFSTHHTHASSHL